MQRNVAIRRGPGNTFGQLVAVGTAATALPAFANVDPPRMFQLQARFIF